MRGAATSVNAVAQPSLLSAEVAPPELGDLGGLLAAHGQTTSGPGGARVSILLADAWRASVLRAECARRQVAAQVRAVTADGTREATLLRSERCERLRAVTDEWTRGAVKSVPARLVLDAGLLRIWVIAAGRRGEADYLLGLDPHARDTHRPLAAALARAGLAGRTVGVQSGGPAVRISGRRRLALLAEMVGEPPDGAPHMSWPSMGG